MSERFSTKISRIRRTMSLTWAIVALAVGVILPVLLATSVGIVALALGESSADTVIGVLVICFAVAALGSAFVVTILLGKRARLARAQADFTANVTHELRTPLTSIRMYAQTLQMGRLKPGEKRYDESINTIIRETEWLEAMIDRVLSWRALGKDNHHHKREPKPLTKAVDEAVARFERMMFPGEVQFDVSIETEKPVLHDTSAITSMILNLLINAYKYTSRNKKITLKVMERSQTEAPEQTVELSVEDNGIGIPKREVGKIFDPYYRVDSRLRSNAAGAGLGLAIVKRVSKLHGGHVYVESCVGTGSKFMVRFPTYKERI